jgi:hypothetical protein
MVDLNPMTHGTENVTKSAHHPVVDLRSRRLSLTRLQVVSEKVDLKSMDGCLLWIDKARVKDKTYMSVGVMEDYKLRDLRDSHTLGWSWNWNT